jgi:ribose-phosphate pyrophosphokinase
VTAVIPYLAYARKDRRTKSRDPVTIRYVAQLLEAVGTDQVVVLDVHNLAAYENAFRCRAVHLSARRLILRHVTQRLRGQAVAVMSPDFGGIKRVEDFLDILRAEGGTEAALAFMEKRRSKGVVSGEQVVGDVEGRNVVLLDDLISTGGTMLRAARAALQRGAASVVVAASHGVFTQGADETLADPALREIVVTNSAGAPRLSGPARAKLVVLDIAGLLAQTVRRLHEGGSIVELLDTWPPAGVRAPLAAAAVA